MQQHEQNGWFYGREFMRACEAISNAAGSLSFMEAGRWDCKYIQIYVDQRTGSFILRTGDGRKLSTAEVYSMFPSLRDDGEEVPEVKIVAAGVRPYPE
jgi:hypothetical protein